MFCVCVCVVCSNICIIFIYYILIFMTCNTSFSLSLSLLLSKSFVSQERLRQHKCLKNVLKMFEKHFICLRCLSYVTILFTFV